MHDATRSPTNQSVDYDVIVIGGAFSGSSLAWLLATRQPGTRILLVEKSATFDRKVGESTSEVAGCFLTRVLRAGDYLAREQVAKHGLHLWYNDPEDANHCPSHCTEIGPEFQARLPTYQLNRSLLDEYLLERAVALPGVELLRPASLRSLQLADDEGAPTEDDDRPHLVTIRTADKQERTLSCRWLIDASGRAAVLARRHGTLERNEAHPVNSMWTRFRGVRHFDSWENEGSGLKSDAASPRYNATNHFCGYGWWCWLIPLENGELSAGLTWDPRLFTPEKRDRVADTLLHHLRRHPVGRVLFEQAEAVENDTRTYRHLPYRNSRAAGRRWVAIGDAAGFMDPLYSQGLDYCAHSTFSALKLIEADRHNKRACALASARYNADFQCSYQRWFDAIYRDKYAYLGDAELMRIAYLLDVGIYFVAPVRFVYADTESEFASMPYIGGPGGAVARFMACYNRRLVTIALKRRAAGRYGRRNLDHHYLVKAGFGPNKLAVRQILLGLRLWAKAELNALFLPRADRDQAFGKANSAPAPAPEREEPRGQMVAEAGR